MKDGRFVQTMDSRFPTSITADEITAAMREHTDPIGATFENTLLMVPFLVKPDTPEIQTLLAAYNEITARRRAVHHRRRHLRAQFSRGASFRPGDAVAARARLGGRNSRSRRGRLASSS